MPASPEQILPATSPQDLAVVRQLFEEYAASIAIDLCFQNFSAELAGLPGAYAPPRGRLFVAWVDGVPAGCVALRPKDDHAGEVKRLYVRPAHQGLGLGRRLAGRVVTEARSLGYTSLLLDTLPTMLPAIRLYESLGFVRRSAYYAAPETNVFMELKF